MRSAGIEIELTHKPLLGELKHQRYKGLISPVDGTGTQLVMLTQEMLAGDLHLLQVVTSDEQGIIECSSRRGLTKKMFAKLPETFALQTGANSAMFAEADYDYAMALILEAETLTETIPEEYTENKELFELAQAQPIENPVFRMLDVENLKNQPYFLRTSADLFQNDVFLSWHLPVNETAEYAQELLDQQRFGVGIKSSISATTQRRGVSENYCVICHRRISQTFAATSVHHGLIFLTQNNEEDAKKAMVAAADIAGNTARTLKRARFSQAIVVS